jgi:hypothetical protein
VYDVLKVYSLANIFVFAKPTIGINGESFSKAGKLVIVEFV